jgi:MFS transporter, ACDE family, multidrug resistance protein
MVAQAGQRVYRTGIMTPKPPRSTPLFLQRELMIIFSITLISVMGVSSITPILPEVGRVFGVSPQGAGWLVAAFTLPGVILTPCFGLLSDRYGRKRILVPSILVFAIAGHACAYVDSFSQLVILRVIQGAGVASLSAINITLIGDMYEGHERASVTGYNSGFISTAAAAYPAVGGALALIGWRYPFVLPLIGLPIALAIMLWLKNPEPRMSDSFATYMRKLWRSLLQRGTAAMLFSSLVAFVLLYGPLVTFMPFLLEDKFNASSVDIGWVMASCAVGSAVASVFTGRLIRRFRGRHILIVTFFLMALSTAMIPFVGSIWAVAAAVALLGANHGIGISVVQVRLAETGEPQQRGALMALNATMFRTGQTVGPLVMGALLALGGMEAVYLGGGAVGMLAVLVLVVSMRSTP